MEAEMLLPLSIELLTCPSPTSDQSNPHQSIFLYKIYLNGLRLDLPICLFSYGFVTSNLHTVLFLTFSCYMLSPPDPPRLDNYNCTWLRAQIAPLPIMQFLPCTSQTFSFKCYNCNFKYFSQKVHSLTKQKLLRFYKSRYKNV
jgi:hypothetical protein